MELSRGDTLIGSPCRVVVEKIVYGYQTTVALAHCATCQEYHLIDADKFNQGEGPWKRKTA